MNNQLLEQNGLADRSVVGDGSGAQSANAPAITYSLLGVHLESFLRPRDPLGGDWCMLRPDDRGGLWLMVADTQGKSWQAWLKKRCVFLLWQRAWRRQHGDVIELLSTLDGMLNDAEEAEQLPRGFFIEATIGIVDDGGRLTLASAGGAFVILCRANESASDSHTDSERDAELSIHRLGGPLLGLGLPVSFSSTRIELEPGDALACTTDGIPDQHLGDERLGEVLPERLSARVIPQRGLHASLLDVYEEAVAFSGQFDDTTVLTITRLESE